jgi:hypothetical protein
VPANSHNNLNRWKNYFSQLLNVYSVVDSRQVKIHTAELLLPHHNHLEVEIAVVKLKMYKLPGNDHVPAELIPARDETLQSEIDKLSNFTWNKEELPDQWKESIIVPIYKKDGKVGCSNYHGISMISNKQTTNSMV